MQITIRSSDHHYFDTWFDEIIRDTNSTRRMKAMLLAAGEGTRLRPLTNTVPKCMVPIFGKPLLEWTVAWLARFGINELVVNLHYLPEVVPAYFGDGERWGVRMTYSHEEEILGTAGAVRRVKDQFTEPFLVWYGDNLSNIDLPRLLKEHEEHGGIGTISLSWLDDPTMSGIVSVDENQRIERFLEKPRPEQVFSHWVNAGVYILDPAIFDYIPGTESPDFGKDVFPAVLACGQALFGYRFSPREKLWLIDTPNKLESVTSDPAVEAAFQ